LISEKNPLTSVIEYPRFTYKSVIIDKYIIIIDNAAPIIFIYHSKEQNSTNLLENISFLRFVSLGGVNLNDLTSLSLFSWSASSFS